MRDIIRESYCKCPVVEGPIEVNENSHPFCAMEYCRTPLDLDAYGYLEEEYFLTGEANVYEADENDDLRLFKKALPYKNRVLVRRPKMQSDFSGRVYVDILNATQGYDIEDLWHRNYLWCMEQGHAYVGITSKPINVLSLKNFDYDRYCDLNWSNGEVLPAPVVSKTATIPGTEEGLIWDMLSQLGYLLRQNRKDNCVGGYKVEYVYLTGQSQSGAYLNTYVSYFDQYINAGQTHIYDGYLNIVGALVQRSLRQENCIGSLKLQRRNMHPSSMPYICISSEADLYLFSQFLDDNLLEVEIKNTDTEKDKCRYYEIPAAPHTDIICPILTAVSEIEKTGAKIPNLNPKLIDHINDIPVDYYVCGMLEKLHRWAVKGEAPEAMRILIRKDGDLQRDSFGNAEGGFRTPYVDIPIAKYLACNPEDPEGICGKMEYFSLHQIKEKYGSIETYICQFEQYVDRQQEQGWISETNAIRMREWCRRAVIEKIK